MSSPPVPRPTRAHTYNVRSLHNTLVPVSVTPDTPLSSILQQATTTEPAPLLPHLRLCLDRHARELPDVLSVIDPAVLRTTSVQDIVDWHTIGDAQLAVVLHISLRCLCRIEPVVCAANHSTTIGDIQRQFFTAWHRSQQLPFDESLTLAFYQDESRSTEWESITNESPFSPAWLQHGAQSPLFVRVVDGDGESQREAVHQQAPLAAGESEQTVNEVAPALSHCGEDIDTTGKEYVTLQLVTNSEDGDTVTLMDAEIDYTVHQLIADAPYDRPVQQITYAGTPLPEQSTLRQCAIPPTARLSITFWPPTTLHPLTIKTLASTNNSIPFHVHRHITIRQLKSMVKARLDVPYSQQRLVYGGKQLMDDGLTLDGVGIGPDAVVHLVLRLC